MIILGLNKKFVIYSN